MLLYKAQPKLGETDMSEFKGTNTLVVMMPPRMKRQLRKRADEKRVSMNEYVRGALAKQLREDRGRVA